jgi:hypothetical protein
LIKPILTGVPVAFLSRRKDDRAAGALADETALAEPLAADVAVVLLEPPPELAVLELLLQAAAPATVRAANRVRGSSGTRREAPPAPLPCFVEIIPSLAGRRGPAGRSRRDLPSRQMI